MLRDSKSWLTAFYSLLLAAGLFCVQVCQVVCATVACASETATQQAPAQSGHAHCHPQPQPASPTRQPNNHSHDCKKHAVLQSLLPDNQSTKQQAPTDWQPDFIAPFIWAETGLNQAVLNKPAPTPFKPPPRQQHTTVQRI